MTKDSPTSNEWTFEKALAWALPAYRERAGAIERLTAELDVERRLASERANLQAAMRAERDGLRVALTEAREFVRLLATAYSHGPAEVAVDRIDAALAGSAVETEGKQG